MNLFDQNVCLPPMESSGRRTYENSNGSLIHDGKAGRLFLENTVLGKCFWTVGILKKIRRKIEVPS
ncbi:protein of unknown function [Ruminococcaceae bacterium BL-6]|nr:protein of unknown function [Ruminococcaceae bacterium BL-6]